MGRSPTDVYLSDLLEFVNQGLKAEKPYEDEFMDSGLSVVLMSGLISKLRPSAECKDELRQRKRREAVANNKDVDGRTFCSDGAKVVNGSMCFEVVNLHTNTSVMKGTSLLPKGKGTARSRRAGAVDIPEGIFDIPENIDDLTARIHFKDSTLFENYVIGPGGQAGITMYLPSSITKWMIQALTVSPNFGFCVANPTNLTVFKPLYIDVNLPFKAVRGEQLEVKVTVYNFQEIATTVVVYMYDVAGICSEALPEKKTVARRFRIPPNDAVSTSYAILPLEVRPFNIKVVAFTFLGGDLVEKKLYVVAEGKRITKYYSFNLDLQDRLEDDDVQPWAKRADYDIKHQPTKRGLNDTACVIAGGFKAEEQIYVDISIPPETIEGSVSAIG